KEDVTVNIRCRADDRQQTLFGIPLICCLDDVVYIRCVDAMPQDLGKFVMPFGEITNMVPVPKSRAELLRPELALSLAKDDAQLLVVIGPRAFRSEHSTKLSS